MVFLLSCVIDSTTHSAFVNRVEQNNNTIAMWLNLIFYLKELTWLLDVLN